VAPYDLAGAGFHERAKQEQWIHAQADLERGDQLGLVSIPVKLYNAVNRKTSRSAATAGTTSGSVTAGERRHRRRGADDLIVRAEVTRPT
jgi:hypothetical protein